MDKQHAYDIIHKLMPGVEIVESPRVVEAEADTAADQTRPGPSLDDFRRKYEDYHRKVMGGSFRDSARGSSGADATADEDVEVVRVRPKAAGSDPLNDPGPKTVIVSKHGVLGCQG